MNGSVVEYIKKGVLKWHYYFNKSSKASDFFKHELEKLNPTDIVAKSTIGDNKLITLADNTFLVLTTL